MVFVIFKCAYSSLLKTSRLRLRFKSFSQILKPVDIIEDMAKNVLVSDKSDTSLSFIGLEVLGNSSGISPCGVSLNTTCRCYLFNCGEGLQKIMSEYKIKPSKYQDIFITYPSWKNIGGVVGTALAMQECRVKFFNIHGHACLGGLFSMIKKIANFKGIKQTVKCYDNNSKFSDEFINVEFVRIYNSASVNFDRNLTGTVPDQYDKAGSSSTKEENNLNNNEHFTNFSTSEYKGKNFDDAEKKDVDGENHFTVGNRHDYAMGFIVHTGKSQGSLSFERCMDLGVPVGPLLGKLKKGEDVTLENGNVVKSSDVKFPDLPGVIVIVVECPSEDYLDALLNEPKFFKHQLDGVEYYACAVVHFSSSKIIRNHKYQKWITRFTKETKHIFVNESSEIGAFVGLHRHQFKLTMVHPEIFPPLHTFGIPDFPRIENCQPDVGHVVADVPPFMHDKNSPLQIHSDKVYYQCKNNFHILGETLCEICIKPKRRFDYSKCLTLKKKEYLQEVLALPNIRRELAECKKRIQSIEKRSSQSDRKLYPKIVFLGTGSKKPSKTRNSSGILVFLDEKKSIILDCGESIYCQLLLFFGKEKTREILRNLSAIFVSHLHVDHHLGLPALLLERKLAFDEFNELESGSHSLASESINIAPIEPLTIIAPVQILPWLHYLSKEIFCISDLYKLIPCTLLTESQPEQKLKDIISDLSLESMQTVAVDHAPNSFGVSIKHMDGWKLTYSGDTKPCKSLVDIGKDSDVLIHEATFDDIFEKEAKEKLHSTTGQAILIGRKMNAKFILLTHFSQRYCHLPVIQETLLCKADVGVAFDFMQVSPYQFPILPHLYESLKLVFTVYQEKLEHQNCMLKIKRERENNSDETSSGINQLPAKIRRMKQS